MDELAKDLNNALDESSDLRIRDTKFKRSKTWKCRSKSKCAGIFGSNPLKYSAKSEDSESSFDNCPDQEIDISSKGSYHCTDSDDTLCKVNQHHHNHLSWRQSSSNLVESDSVNENLHPLREPRRKRKFKRMTIDPPNVSEHELPNLTPIPFCTQKNKRLRNLKSQTTSKVSLKSPKHSNLVSQISAEMENICNDFENDNASTGKRKRCSHDKNVECTGYECKDICILKNDFSLLLDKEKPTSKVCDINSSGVSSSESDCGVLANDESREADDEQSDFFQESGPAYGIPDLGLWWEDVTLPDDDDEEDEEEDFFGKDFPGLLCPALQHLNEATKEMYRTSLTKYKTGREIRSARRRLGKKPQGLCKWMIRSDELDSENDDEDFSLPVDNCFAKVSLNEKKKRKGMPPLSGNIHGFEESIPKIPDSNIGLQVLKNMGSKPGSGLGRIGEGIISPVKAFISHGKQGLGFSKKESENIDSSPPPPPSSPQPFAL